MIRFVLSVLNYSIPFCCRFGPLLPHLNDCTPLSYMRNIQHPSEYCVLPAWAHDLSMSRLHAPFSVCFILRAILPKINIIVYFTCQIHIINQQKSVKDLFNHQSFNIFFHLKLSQLVFLTFDIRLHYFWTNVKFALFSAPTFRLFVFHQAHSRFLSTLSIAKLMFGTL